jgi:hypothetical protein
MEERIDAVLAAEIGLGGPGAAITALRDGQFIHRKAYGLANIEWGVPLNLTPSFASPLWPDNDLVRLNQA